MDPAFSPFRVEAGALKNLRMREKAADGLPECVGRDEIPLELVVPASREMVGWCRYAAEDGNTGYRRSAWRLMLG